MVDQRHGKRLLHGIQKQPPVWKARNPLRHPWVGRSVVQRSSTCTFVESERLLTSHKLFIYL